MPALDFPANPTNGQVYQNWIYSTSKGAWQAKPLTSAVATPSDTAPLNPDNGDLWYNTTDGSTYVYYVDGTSAQWVQTKSDSTFTSTLGPRVDVLEAKSPNYIINGNFDIWQRGTSFSSPGYTADRWYFSYGGTVTVSRESSIVPTNSMYSAKVTTGASSSFGEIYQAFELSDIEMMQGKTITFSTLVRAQSSFSGTAVIAIQTNTTANTQTGGTWTEVASATITPSTSAFNRVSVSYAVPANTNGIRVRMAMTSAQASGTGLYWAQSQLEEGSVATPFRRNASSTGEELSVCQRYFLNYPLGSSGLFVGPAHATGTTQCQTFVAFPVTMRVAPTPAVSSAAHFNYHVPGVVQQAATGMNVSVSSQQTITLNFTGFIGSFGYGVAGRIETNTTAATLTFSAEL